MAKRGQCETATPNSRITARTATRRHQELANTWTCIKSRRCSYGGRAVVAGEKPQYVQTDCDQVHNKRSLPDQLDLALGICQLQSQAKLYHSVNQCKLCIKMRVQCVFGCEVLFQTPIVPFAVLVTSVDSRLE